MSSSTTRIILAIAGVAAFGCLCFTCGSGFTYWAVPWSKGALGKVDGKENDAALGKNSDAKITKAAEKWGWQDLQDHLASKGMKTNRAAGGGGMWFVPGDGKALGRHHTIKIDYDGKPLAREEWIDYPAVGRIDRTPRLHPGRGPTAQRPTAAGRRDADQRPARGSESPDDANGSISD